MNKTVDYYNRNAKDYANGTVIANMHETQSKFISLLNPGAHIFDIGCGSGRDSKFFIDNGFRVTAMDASTELCEYAKQLINQEVLCMTFDEIAFKSEFDAAWACASLLHVEKNKMIDTLHKVSVSLKPEGILYVSYKYGQDEIESNGRHFSNYTEDDIPYLFSEATNLICIEWWISEDVRPDRKGEKWLNIFSRVK